MKTRFIVHYRHNSTLRTDVRQADSEEDLRSSLAARPFDVLWYQPNPIRIRDFGYAPHVPAESLLVGDSIFPDRASPLTAQIESIETVGQQSFRFDVYCRETGTRSRVVFRGTSPVPVTIQTYTDHQSSPDRPLSAVPAATFVVNPATCHQ